MRRRRQKNTLLPKMLGIAVLLNAILLPILAQFGVFKGMTGGQRLTPVQLVQAPPPPPKPKERARKAHPRVAHRLQPARRAAPREAARARPALSHPNLIAGAPSKGAGSGPTVNPLGTGAAGQVPTVAPTPAPTVTPSAPVTPGPPVVTPSAPPPAPAPPPPVQPAPAPPHVPALVPATVLSRVEPQVPSDLADETLPATFRAVFAVHADGTVTVRPDGGTGNGTLDRLALDAARRWTFRPATEDGRPVDSYLRLTVNFVASDMG